MKEILLYGPIWSYSARDFINEMNRANDDVSLRINSGGGEVDYGWGMITKWKEHKGSKSIIVDGAAHSMALNFLLYADKGSREAVDVANFVFHRAAYYSVDFEKSYLSEGQREQLKSVNESLEAAFRNTIDVEKFEKIKGVTVDEVFSMEDRIDVNLTAKEAKAIGLIDRIITITPQKSAEISAQYKRIAAMHGGFEIPVEKPQAENKPEKVKQVNMTIEQLQAEHPAVYSAIFNKGVVQGESAERDRVGAWAAFNEIDPAKVKAGIESGLPVSQTAMAEFSVASFKASALNTLTVEGENPAGQGTTESQEATTATEEAKAKAEFAEKLNAAAGLTPKTV